MKLLLRGPTAWVREEGLVVHRSEEVDLGQRPVPVGGVMDRPAISMRSRTYHPSSRGENALIHGVEARQGLEALVVGEVEERLAVGPLDDEPAEVGAVEQVGDVRSS